MIDLIEALEALRATGTMGKAGLRLRISQSAVSKRIATLEARLGEALIVRDGRRVGLTPRAEHLLERLAAPLGELRSALADEEGAPRGVLSLGVSESLLASHAARWLHRVKGELPVLELDIHAHRSVAVQERVASGEYLLGLMAGHGDAPGLASREVFREAMVVIPRGLDPKALKRGDTPVITIEERSGTWQAIGRRAKQAGIVPERALECFFAAAQLAVTGFGHGLVPIGVAAALRLPATRLKVLGPELARPISLVARRSVLARPLVQAFGSALDDAIRRDAAPGARPRR